MPSAVCGWKWRVGDYPWTKTDLPVTTWSLTLMWV